MFASPETPVSPLMPTDLLCDFAITPGRQRTATQRNARTPRDSAGYAAPVIRCCVVVAFLSLYAVHCGLVIVGCGL
jgi:hypothetical protein